MSSHKRPRSSSDACAECGSTAELQPDEFSPGTAYCMACWERFREGAATAAATAAALPGAEHYLLTAAQLAANDYPSAALLLDGDEQRTDDGREPWIAAPPPPPIGAVAASSAAVAAAPPPPRLVAVDCEMVGTALGSELARVTAVDEAGAVLLDTLVRPARPVLDYRTAFSGITAALLEAGGATTLTLAEAREALFAGARIRPGHDRGAGGAGAGAGVGAGAGSVAGAGAGAGVDGATILVGHGLENDLAALRLVHDRVIDTAVLYPKEAVEEGGICRGKYKLKALALELLGRIIQDGGSSSSGSSSSGDGGGSGGGGGGGGGGGQQQQQQQQQQGHDSVEDARAAMELALLKISMGPGFNVDHDTWSLPPLLQAAEAGDAPAVAAIAAAEGLGAAVVARALGQRLVEVCEPRKLDCRFYRLLAVPGVDANVQNPFGGTALCVCAQHGNARAVRALLAVPGIDLSIANRKGITALQRARAKGFAEIEQLLLRHAAAERSES